MRASTVQYERWAPVYERIRADLGFRWEAERASGAALRELVAGAPGPSFATLARRLQGRDVVVVGQAPGAGPPPMWRLPTGEGAPLLAVADGATPRCLDAGLVPDVVVTDLDGPVESEIVAAARGARLVVHAHGDNLDLLQHWVPQFDPAPLATWAGPPDPPLLDFGGFTDGDRAAYLAEAAGARRILLWGFDFDRTDPREPDPDRKLRKLRWAAVALAHLATTAPGRIFTWTRDGRILGYIDPTGGSTTHATDSLWSS